MEEKEVRHQISEATRLLMQERKLLNEEANIVQEMENGKSDPSLDKRLAQLDKELDEIDVKFNAIDEALAPTPPPMGMMKKVNDLPPRFFIFRLVFTLLHDPQSNFSQNSKTQ